MKRFIAVLLALALAVGVIFPAKQVQAAEIALSAEFGGWLSTIMFNLFGIAVGHDVYEMLTDGELSSHLPQGALTQSEIQRLEEWQRETAQRGQIVLDSETRQIWAKASKSVAQNGFVTSRPTAAITGIADMKSFMYANGYNVSMETQFQQVMNNVGYLGGAPITMAYFAISANQMYIVMYSATLYPYMYWRHVDSTRWQLWQVGDADVMRKSDFRLYERQNDGVWVQTGGSSSGTLTTQVNPYNDIYGNLGATQGTTTIPASDPQTIADAEAGTMAIITPFTDATDFDNADPVVIPIPQALPIPADTVADIPNVIAQLPAVVTDTDDTTIPEIAADLASSYPAAGDYNLNLTNYFPFCIPFDLYDIMTSFVAEPVAPSLTIPLPVTYSVEEGVIMEEYTIDLSQFDSVAAVLRMLELVLFGVGLAVATRQIYLRG